ncbi:carboxypeptidase regulatory-like domain-containing protein [Tenacibaculum bernardetii]|uniref:carboxypeptidase regulatory-like domain-containing protein n=1 Tax=Tenacibaculum bernardetii TaxID=3021375 RepID=UPI0023AFD98E|nr:carboxypeptidase regulatory-like domain-containing protein [Tenacibaculum bernardetii]
MKKIIKIAILLISFTLINCGEDTVDFVEFGTIKGRVVKKGSFEPIENAKVALSPTNNTEFTDENGYFTMQEVPTQEYSVSATKEGYLTNFQPVSLEAGSEVNLIFEMDIETALNKPPTTPELRTPTNGVEDLDNTVELSFKSTDPDDDEITYRIEIKNDLDNDILEFTNVKDTLYTVSNLKFGAKYFWQIAASDGINSEVLSATNTFKVTSSPNNRYFFTRQENDNNVIYSSDFIDNAPINELLLTSINTNSWRPRKNSATSLIAFLRTDGNETHIFTMNTDGSDVKKVTSSVPVTAFNLNEVDFSWSSNGDRIMYPHYDKLYMINKDGSGLQQVYQTTDGNYITECDWSNDELTIALKTNNTTGYNAQIYTINMSGTIIDTILTGEQGAVGGINFSIDGSKLLYTRDVSNFESNSYRQLDNHMFIYEFSSATITDLSAEKTAGTNDLDPRFSPNEADVIFVSTSNDGVSEKTVYKMNFGGGAVVRTALFSSATMPDWE